MKIKIAILLCSLATWLAACSGDRSQNAQTETAENRPADTAQNHAHGQHGMETVMHNMMDQIHGMNMTNDPEMDFASMMIMHHQGAIDMANLELQKGTDAAMKSMAQKIVADQTREIQELKDYLAANSADKNVPAFSTEIMGNMENMHNAADMSPPTGDVDKDFAAMMKMHHEAGQRNAQTYLNYGTDEKLKAKAKAMLEKQKQDIDELQNWLAENR